MNIEISEYDKDQIRRRVEREELAAAETRARDAYEKQIRAEIRLGYGLVCWCEFDREENCRVHGK